MKATFTHNGKKFIYKVDGRQVRTSQKAQPYEYVAVRLYDGEFCGIAACGQFKTCASYLNMDADIVSRCKTSIELMSGEISFKEYLNRVGYSNAMTPSFFKDIINAGKRDEYIASKRAAIEEHSHYSTIILPFVQE